MSLTEPTPAIGTVLLIIFSCNQATLWMVKSVRLSVRLPVTPFYPRPVLAFGYCRCLRLSVCVCVRQPRACPHHNSSRVQARTTKFEQKMQNNLVKVTIVLGGDWPWPSRSNLPSNSEFTPFWACPHHNSLPIQARITKFGPEVQNSLIKIPVVLSGNWPWPSRSHRFTPHDSLGDLWHPPVNLPRATKHPPRSQVANKNEHTAPSSPPLSPEETPWNAK